MDWIIAIVLVSVFVGLAWWIVTLTIPWVEPGSEDRE